MTSFCLCCLCLLCLLTAAVPAWAETPLSVTLPDGDTYSYWVQSSAGPVTVPPETVTQVSLVKIDAVAAGDRVFVLDSHSGLLASKLISAGAIGTLTPVVLTPADFHPPGASPVSSPAASPAPSVPVPSAPPPTEDNAPYAEAAPAAQPGSQDAPDLRKWLGVPAGLALVAGAGWLLTRRRGQAPAAPAAVPSAPLLVSAPPVVGVAPPEPAAVAPVTFPASDSSDLESTGVTVSPSHAMGQAVSPRAVRPGPQMALRENAALVGIQGLAAGSTFALTAGDVTIGRDGENDIVLAENTVSRFHARLLRDNRGGFTLTDLDSSNGVQVNGRPVRSAPLRSGDEIKIGDNFFRFQAAEDAPND